VLDILNQVLVCAEDASLLFWRNINTIKCNSDMFDRLVKIFDLLVNIEELKG
jgi:hypothetical protein